MEDPFCKLMQDVSPFSHLPFEWLNLKTCFPTKMKELLAPCVRHDWPVSQTSNVKNFRLQVMAFLGG